MPKRIIKTTKQQIANYWRTECTIPENELNFVWADAEKCCWNCGTPTLHLYRCHIIADMFGGIDAPNNMVLLCGDCDNHAPNINDKTAMWDWIRSNKMSVAVKGSYKMQEALRIFKQRNGYNFFDKAIYITNFNDVLTREFDNIGLHGGNITTSSFVYLFENIVKNYTVNDLPQVSLYESFLRDLALLNKRFFAGKVIEGLIKAKAQGRIGGKPRIPQEKIDAIRALKGKSLREIAKEVGVSHRTVKVYLT